MRPLIPTILLAAAVSAFAGDAAVTRGVVVLRNLPSETPARDEIEEPMAVPKSLPLSPEEIQSATREMFAFETKLRPAPSLAASVAHTFAAFRDDNVTRPPDTHGAVGPGHVLTALNAAVIVHDRGGNPLLKASLDAFFAPLQLAKGPFDPRAFYDRVTGRWIISAAGDSRTKTSALLLAVSRSDDPTDAWDLYRYTADTSAAVWLDFPSLGITDRYIVVSANLYNLSDNKFARAAFFIIDKLNPSEAFARFDETNIGGSITPATSYDSGVNTIYFVQRWNGNNNGRGFVRIYTGSATGGISPLAFASTNDPWSTSGGEEEFAPQHGIEQKIDTGDDRITSVVLRNGVLWAAHTIFLPAGEPVRSSVQWFQISTSGAIVQRGTFDDPLGNVFYAYPSIAVNRRNDVMIGFSRFSVSTLPSAMSAFRSWDAPASAFSIEVFKNGEAPYYRPGVTTQRNRWGDYSATLVDPLNDLDFWTIQEYASTPIAGFDRWGTWWVHMAPPASAFRGRSVRH